MNKPDLPQLYDLIDATWPAASHRKVGPWTIREGQGGGSRVSAATADAPFDVADINLAEQAMRDFGQPPLFMVRTIDSTLDASLHARGYKIKDPVTLYMMPTSDLACERPPLVSTFTNWPPHEITREVWAEGGIDAARVAVMQRVTGRKTSILGRIDDAPAASAFVAIGDGVAMLHALEVRDKHRRKGMGVLMIRQAGIWAQENGADWFSLLTTDDNLPSNALYASLGFQAVGHYHYRFKA